MKSTYLKIDALNDMIALADAGRPAPKTVAYGFDQFNQPYVAFLKTDRETGHTVLDVNGNPGLNWRPAKRS